VFSKEYLYYANGGDCSVHSQKLNYTGLSPCKDEGLKKIQI